MGSLALVLSFDGPPDRGAVAHALSAAPHRGAPAGSASVGGASLGVSDDALTDASVASDDVLAVAFVGTMDNLAELAGDLGISAEATPAAVYLHAYRRWGDRAPARVRGPFCVVITDGRTAWASRDPLGLKPLFFRREPRRVAVATEAKQVLAACGRSLEPDLEVVEAIVFREYDDDTPSALKGAERVPRGMTVRLGRNVAARGRYWDPRSILETSRLGEDEIAEAFHAAMTTAAARSLHGDDVVSLSGGIDSPAVAAYAAPAYRERTGERLPALSVVYPRFPEIDESPYIEMVVGRLDLELNTYEESAKTLDEVDGWMAVLDGPLPQFFLAESAEHYRKARSLGFRSMLTGELAEWFVERRDHLIAHLLLHGRFGPLVDHLRRQRRLHGVGPKGLARQLGSAFVTPRIERAWTRVRPAAVEMPPWIDEARLRRVEARYATPARERWSAYQVALFTGPDLAAEAEDVVQAVTGMRVRRPFGDQDLIEFFLRLPAEQKFPDTHYKGLLRNLLRGRLPDPLLDRPSKAVFNRAVLARGDDDALRRLLLDPPHRIPGVRYDVLADRLEHGGFEISEYEWTKNIAATHAWLARW